MPISAQRQRRRQAGSVVSFEVHSIDKEYARDMVIAHHYSGKCPGIKYSYGLFEDARLVGCVVFSVPASYTLCNGVCGKDFREFVIELSRLVVITPTHNAASYLIGSSLADMPDHVVVSYADCNDHVGHIGYVYQATNWIYTGRSNAEPLYVLESDHPSGMRAGAIISYTRRHIDKKARDLGFDWSEGASTGPGLVRRPMVGKHRYVYFTGTKRFRRVAAACLRYKTATYPKGDTRRHTSPVLITEYKKS